MNAFPGAPGASPTGSLTDRYVAAVGRTVPERERAGVEAEVRERIADALDARLAAGADPAAAEREVLTALGDPDRLAADYLGRPLQLIGPKHYLAWSRLLRLLLVIVVPITAAAVALAGAINGLGIGPIIGTAIGTAITVGVHLAFWTTLLFALAERWGRPLHVPVPDLPGAPRLAGRPIADFTGTTEWSLDHLPALQTGESRVTRAQAVASGVFALVFALALVWQQFNPFVRDDAGAPVPVLDPGLWTFWLPYLLCVVAAQLAVTIAVHLIGRYPWWAAVANALVNLAVTIPGIWLWSTGALVNPAFVDAVGLGERDTLRVIGLVGGFVWAGIAAWDVLEGFLRARRSHVGGRG